MSPTLLCLMVALQIIVFQGASVHLSRWMPDSFIGRKGLPADAERRISEYRRRVGRERLWIGLALLALVPAVGFLFPLSQGERKVTLGVISLCSTAVLVAGYGWDARRVLRIGRSVPPAEIRSASLERRSLSDFYPPALELLPLLLLGATVALTLVARPEEGTGGIGTGSSGLGLWLFPAMQVLFIAVMYRMALARTRGWCGVFPNARAYQESPEHGLRLDEEFRRLELRHSLWSKIGVVFLLALLQGRQLAPARPELTRLFGIAEWGTIVVLLAAFGFYMSRIRVLRNSAAALPGTVGGKR